MAAGGMGPGGNARSLSTEMGAPGAGGSAYGGMGARYGGSGYGGQMNLPQVCPHAGAWLPLAAAARALSPLPSLPSSSG